MENFYLYSSISLYSSLYYIKYPCQGYYTHNKWEVLLYPETIKITPISDAVLTFSVYKKALAIKNGYLVL